MQFMDDLEMIPFLIPYSSIIFIVETFGLLETRELMAIGDQECNSRVLLENR